jgi:ABC-2 type transport system ATP-binding protein
MNELSLASRPEIIEPIVSARGLRKKFGRKEILHGLDFDIPPGRIYGLIGHNGAGKTTTLNAMLGLTNCEGTIRVLGEDPFAKRAKLMENVAFISDVASLPRFLRVRELFALLSNIHPNFSQEKAREFLQGTDIKPEMKIKHLSKGMVAQLHLAVVMAIDAKLLVLDEPTLGLDITYRKRFYRRLLEDYMTEERTLLITTHQVDEIEFMLSDIMFIRDGDLILHMQMETVNEKFVQLVVNKPEHQAAARAHHPVYEETRFGQTVMIFDGVDRAMLEPFGKLSTPTLSDLFVALMQRPTANPEAAQ